MTKPDFMLRLDLPDEDATARLGALLAALLVPGDTLMLSGPLGAGKSALARAIIGPLSGESEIPSPSFTLVQTYDLLPRPKGRPATIWHVDLYRLETAAEAGTAALDLAELGLEAAFQTEICVVEWPERLGPLRPRDCCLITLGYGGTPEARTAEITACGPIATRLRASAIFSKLFI